MNITVIKFAISVIIFFLTISPALARPGDLDTTFGGTGKIRVGIGFGNNRARSIAVQPDGKIVVAGEASIGGYEQIALARYNADGTLDPAFGTGGIVITNVGLLESSANAVALQLDGKIVVAGYATNYLSSGSAALLRYNPDGSLDPSFSDDGKLVYPTRELLTDVAIQTDGKILALANVIITRFDSDGTTDRSFGNNGSATTFTGDVSISVSTAVTLQPDGRIIVAGYSNNKFAAARYNPNGSLDPTFSGDGVVTTSSGANSDFAYDVAVQADGKIVISGTSYFSSPNRREFAFVRYNPDGELDPTFDGDGIVRHFVPGSYENSAASLAIQSDGKIVAAGFTYHTSPLGNVFAIVRCNSNGSLDSTFGGDGVVLTSAGDRVSSWASAIALQPDGKIIAAGYDTGEFGNVALNRYKTDGSLDEQFGTGGIVSTDFGHASSAAHAVIVQPDGKILAAGYSLEGFALVRFNVDGTPDTTFGSGGIVMTSRALGPGIIYALALQPNGKIIAAGGINITAANGNRGGFALARYNPNGSLDRSFGNEGIVLNYLGNSQSKAFAVAIQPDGKIVAGGQGQFDFALIRYHSNGWLDAAFDGDGIVTTDMGDYGDTVKAVALQPDGKIVAAGYKADSTTNQRDSAVARYNPDGSLDTSFSGDGKVITPIGGNDDASAAVIQPDGKIITAGQAFTANFNFGLVRYNPDGSLDNTFDSDGIVTTGFGFSGLATALILQPDGKIIAAGGTDPNRLGDFVLVRYKPDGSLDNSFGAGGKSVFEIAFSDHAYALALDSENRVVVAGDTGGLFTVIRLAGGSSRVKAMFDFDGDEKSDVAVFRPSNGVWHLLNSTSGLTTFQFGLGTDKLAPADYDGDGRTDIAVYRDGIWYLMRSRDGFTALSFGTADDIPVPADYDADGKAETAVFRPSNGTWYIYNPVTNQFTGVQFGQAGDIPVTADYDGDGKSDIAVYRAGTWYLQRSRDGFMAMTFGTSTDKPTPADYDGDEKADIAVFRPENGTWYLMQSRDGFTFAAFGAGTDKPVPADYDADGKTDLAVFRNGTWYLRRSTSGFMGIAFGNAADRPVPNAFVP